MRINPEESSLGFPPLVEALKKEVAINTESIVGQLQNREPDFSQM